jgi:Kef-type K+ transport system membrane component KefB
VSPIELAAVLGAVVLVASIVSVELGITVALLELTFGVLVGNVFNLHSQEWLDFIAKFASIVLTFVRGRGHPSDDDLPVAPGDHRP